MKKIYENTVVYTTKYQAADGTVFDDEKECEKYEKSAIGVLNTKYKKILVEFTSEDTLFSGFGNCDNTIDVVDLTSKEDIDTLMQLFFLNNPHMLNDDCKEKNAETRKMLEEALAENSYVLVYRGYDNDSFWITTHIKNVINQLNTFVDEISKSKG